MLRIQPSPDHEPVDIPIEVEHAGEDAIDHYVLSKTGVDLAAQRELAAKTAADRAAATAAAEAAPEPEKDPVIAAALEFADAAKARKASAAIPINPPAARSRRAQPPATKED